MPVQDDALKERPAQEHHQPIAVKRNGLAGGGHVIKIGHTVTEPNVNGFHAIAEQEQQFAQAEIADVLKLLRDAGVDVVTLDAEMVRQFAAGF